mmetsp:Transcript_123513/g.349778  ORF Transcript_123513/g.349778 Transcript_123513/m.349778 type:complete len:754 (-) Transcript_123513:271-2532(-)
MTFTLAANPETLFSDFRRLFKTTTSFRDKELHGANRCILAASCTAAGVAIDPLVADFKAAVPETASALVELMHGQLVALSDVASFFSLFALAGKMQVAVCEAACKAVIEKDKHKETPIQIELSPDQLQTVRSRLLLWQRKKNPLLSDATISHKDATFKVHSVVLAASCEYLRGLWAGGFREAAGWHKVHLLDNADFEAAKLIAQLLYGDTVKVEGVEKLVQLFCLADRWQCPAISCEVLKILRDSIDIDSALAIVCSAAPCAERLFRCAVDALKNKSNLVEEEPLALKKLSLLGAVRIVASSADQDSFLTAVRRRLLRHLFTAGAKTPGLEQLDPATLGSVLALVDVVPTTTLPKITYSGRHIKMTQQGTVQKLLLSTKLSHDSNEAIDVLGPACIKFAKVELGSSDSMSIGTDVMKTGFVRTVQSGDTIKICSRSSRHSSKAANWELVVTAAVPAPPLPPSDQLVQPLLAWALEAPHTNSDAACSMKPMPSAPPVLNNLVALHSIAQAQNGSVFKELVNACFVRMFDTQSPDLVLEVMGLSADDVHPAKRRRTEGGGDAKGKQTQSDLQECAARWVGASARRIEALARCAGWEKLGPPTLAKISRFAGDGDCEQFTQACAKWACAASVPDVTDALGLFRAASGKRDEAIFNVLADSLRDRLVQAEKSIAVLEGGKFHDEMERAVDAASAEVELRVRAELAKVETQLRAEMSREQELRKSDAAQHRRTIETLRTNIWLAFETEISSQASDAGA